MTLSILNFSRPVTLVGGGTIAPGALKLARSLAPALIAADSAADALLELGLTPSAIIGDMDSIADLERWRDGPWTMRHLPEQDTTDFEKCLYATEAPFYLGVGFTGGRLDHTLAVLSAMLARPEKTVILLGEGDAIAFVPPGRVLDLKVEAGAMVSFFPLRPARGVVCEGLEWPVDGLRLAPGIQSGTSNRAVVDQVRVSFDSDGILIMLDQGHVRTLVDAIVQGR